MSPTPESLMVIKTTLGWVLALVIGCLIMGCIVLVLTLTILEHLRKRAKKTNPDTDILLDAIDGLRDQVDQEAQHTVSEHKGMADTLKTVSGRMQWMVANDLADEETRLREIARVEAAKKEKADANPDPPIP